MAEVDALLEQLKTKKHRITRVRRAVLELLCASAAPVSAAELIEGLKKHALNVNKTTVYREIEFLLEKRIVRSVDLQEGMKRYELVGDDHHHHVVCLRCHRIRCIDMEQDLDFVEKRIRDRYGFKVMSHTLEFFGLCEDCL